LAQRYHPSDRTRQGIRIAAAAGSPVSAAADGEVVYSGSSGLAGYGNLIIVKHNPRYLSAYGFNRRVLVSEGARVKRGQQLAEVGQSAAGQPMLHFEIRRDGATVDPLLFLPAAR
jgi:lipoprotein NlpD